jgi:Domain of unknown function (DUF5666)
MSPADQWEEFMKANGMTVAALAGVALGALTMMVAGIAAVLAQDTVRVRGAIERIDGSTYVIKARDGAELKVTLADNPQIAGVVKASLSDIKQGSFVGVTAMPQADGSQIALEVHIFPETMRGTGEGHYPWDLRPQSTMTNANVEQVVTAVDGQTLTLKYKDGEKKILVPANTPIVSYVTGDQSDLKAGAKIFIVAIKQPDGTLQGRAWRVGRDGVTPPM